MPKVFTRKELEKWLWEIVSNNDNDFWRFSKRDNQ